MKEELSIEEEMKIEQDLREPFGDYIAPSLSVKKKIAHSILSREEKTVLLLDKYGFTIDFIFAGLTEKHIEYITKNAPKDYKDNILKLLQDQETLKGVFEIARAMDGDLGREAMQNQDRVGNVIQYIKDNRIAFEF
ncbi:MAG: hypothetical protein WC906_05460 [Parcubacteria group bacterium]|jgi:hypothetical protein